MNLAADPSTALLAASGGDTVKLFDVTVDSGDPCTLSYTPSPGFAVNSVKWNHTNLVVASAGEDKKISLWRKNGESLGTIGSDSVDFEERIYAINFSNKVSRYLCCGGSGQVVRIWDLRRKRCIKWLKGHTDTITGVMYNCKDEQLASISLGGDLILHNLASGAKAELKDPDKQILRVLDYSRSSRHLLVTAGDDGTVRLWDTNGRNPKISWSKQHSAPTAGISFSPSNDKIVATVGLDKKLYINDTGSRRPQFSISYEAPFTSLAFRDDGLILAAGTSNGHVVFYDVRGKPQPQTVLRAYSSSEAVTSLCWQRSKPVSVNENNCSAEVALLGGAVVEDSVVMPDPLPSMTASNPSLSSGISGTRSSNHLGFSSEISSLNSASTGSTSLSYLSSAEETPLRSHLRPVGTLTRLHPSRSSYNFMDGMEVFSPVVDVQPITPSLDKLSDDPGGSKKDHFCFDKKPSFSRSFPHFEDEQKDHPGNQFKSNSTARQLGSTPMPSLSKSEETAITPPEAWGGEKLPDRFNQLRQSLNLPYHFGSVPALQSQTSVSSLTNSSLNYADIGSKDFSLNQGTKVGSTEHAPVRTLSSPLGMRGAIGHASPESPKPTSFNLAKRFLTSDGRINTASFSDGISLGSPKVKKTGDETTEVLNSWLSRSDVPAASDTGILPPINGASSQSQRAPQPDPQQGSSFTLQLFQRTLEETLDSFKRSIHEDIRNLHLDVLRQFHMQEMEFSNALGSLQEKQAELMNEVKNLRKENQQLRQLL